MRYAVVMCLFLCGCNQQPATPPKIEVGVDEAQLKRVVDEAVAKTSVEFSKTIRAAFDAEQKHRQAIADADAQRFADAQKLAELRRQAELAKIESAEAKRRYESDIARAATLNHDEQLRLRSISDKRKQGGRLDRVEIEMAMKFNEFKDFATSESEMLAKENGFPTSK